MTDTKVTDTKGIEIKAKDTQEKDTQEKDSQDETDQHARPKTILPEHVTITPQETPNPFAWKFILNFPVKNEGKATLHSSLEWPGSPLVADLFQLPGVRQLHLFQNVLTVTHSGELDESELIDQVSAVVRTRLAVHNPDFSSQAEAATQERKRREGLSAEILQIEEILDRTVRPGLQSDGGDIEVLSFENDEVKILYQGACGGCPSSMSGTLDAIQSILSHELGLPSLQVTPI